MARIFDLTNIFYPLKYARIWNSSSTFACVCGGVRNHRLRLVSTKQSTLQTVKRSPRTIDVRAGCFAILILDVDCFF